MRGVLQDTVERGVAAAPAAAACNRDTGRPRPAVRRHYDRLPLKGWTRRATKGGGSRLDGTAESRSRLPSRKHGPRGQKSRGGASEGDAPALKARPVVAREGESGRFKWTRLSVLHPSHSLKRRRRLARRSRKAKAGRMEGCTKPGATFARGNEKACPMLRSSSRTRGPRSYELK